MKKTTNLLKVLVLAMVLIACLSLFLVSCGECEHTGGEATCTKKAVCTECSEEYGELEAHSYADATCTAPKTCKECGATDGKALGHNWDDATCEAPKTCETCGATEGEALGHDWTDATCTDSKICSICSAVEGNPLGHNWQDATCTTPKTCANCGGVEGEALGHSWNDATCENAKTCGTCGATEGEALGHDWVEATCYEAKYCLTCGETDGEALGHNIVENVIAPTCTKPGITQVSCTRCDDETYEKDYVSETGHTSANGVCSACGVNINKVTLDQVESLVPSHETGGYANVNNLFDGVKKTSGIWSAAEKEYYAGVAGDYLVITLKEEYWVNEIILWGMGNYTFSEIELFDAEGNSVHKQDVLYNGGDAYGGNSAAVSVTLANSAKVKSIKYTAKSLKDGGKGTSHKTSEIEIFINKCAGDHKWLFNGYDENNAPTCDIEGIANYVCVTCGAEKQEYTYHRFIAPVGHVEGQEPTCTEYGYSVFECMWCTEQETRMVPPEHDYDVTAVPPTCTENGTRTYTCTICGDTYDEVIESTGHNQKWQCDSTTATCTEAGVEIYGCYNCDAKIEVPVDAYGHDWTTDFESINTATHTATQNCRSCDATQETSTLGWEEDPIVITVPGNFTVNASGSWVYYTYEHVEGYITFTFDTTNVNAMVKDLNEVYTTQFFWGGDTTWRAELMEAGSYVIAISTGDSTEFDINVTTEFEETDVPDLGETAEKPIVMEGINTGYTSAGKVWYTIETPYAGTVSITVTGDATVLYGTDPENLVEYEAPFVDEYGYTTYYICVESVNDAEIVVNVEAPVGSIEKPLDLVVGENSVSTQGGWNAYYAVYMPTVNGTITITFDAETYATVQIMTGGNPYMMYTPVANGGTIQVYAWTECYIGITTSDFEPVEFTLTLAFEEEVLTPPEPEGDIGDKIGTIDVETTDTYGYFDMYTYTAEKAGKYTFFVPGKLGFYSSEKYDAFADAEADYNSNLAGAYVTVELAAGEEFSFYVGATTKGEWTIDVYCLASSNVGGEGVENEDGSVDLPED